MDLICYYMAYAIATGIQATWISTSWPAKQDSPGARHVLTSYHIFQ